MDRMDRMDIVDNKEIQISNWDGGPALKRNYYCKNCRARRMNSCSLG